jgi:hypothetical protein
MSEFDLRKELTRRCVVNKVLWAQSHFNRKYKNMQFNRGGFENTPKIIESDSNV